MMFIIITEKIYTFPTLRCFDATPDLFVHSFMTGCDGVTGITSTDTLPTLRCFDATPDLFVYSFTTDCDGVTGITSTDTFPIPVEARRFGLSCNNIFK